MINLLGGGIKALCQKKGQFNQLNRQLTSLLACPDCRKKVKKMPDCFRCPNCHQKFPIKNGVIYLLPNKLMQKLYQGIF